MTAGVSMQPEWLPQAPQGTPFRSASQRRRTRVAHLSKSNVVGIFERWLCPRSSVDRALASGARGVGSSPAGGTPLPHRHTCGTFIRCPRAKRSHRARYVRRGTPDQRSVTRSSPTSTPVLDVCLVDVILSRECDCRPRPNALWAGVRRRLRRSEVTIGKKIAGLTESHLNMSVKVEVAAVLE